MSDFNVIADPMHRCMFCGDFAGPMVNTNVLNEIARAPIFVCGPTESRAGCIGNMAQLFGYIHPREAIPLKAENAELKRQLKDAQSKKPVTISYGDLGRLVVTGTNGGATFTFDGTYES